MSVRPEGGWVLARSEPEFPEQLNDLPDPPELLYGFGDPALLGGGLGVIGARKATPYGRACAHRFSAWAAAQGIPVVSGAAIGCDLEAHIGALSVDGPTVAVLGCGADVNYPVRAADTLATIRRVGAVVSEAPWGSGPHRWAFPRRNRLIAALSRTLLVVEASLPSGTFSTADHALGIGREVCAIPGSIFAPECRGANRLIRQGATPITDVSELAQELGIHSAEIPEEPGGSPDRMLAALIANPSRPDDLARDLDVDIVTAIRSLTRLEAEGVLKRYPDGRYGIARPSARLQSHDITGS